MNLTFQTAFKAFIYSTQEPILTLDIGCNQGTIQLTTDSPNTCVRKCSLTAVSCAFPPWSRTNQWQSE